MILLEYIKIVFTSIASIITLFFLAKIMGKRQISQLSLFDYINGITIGSIAAEMATSLDGYGRPFVAMIIYGLMSALISMATCKSIKLRRFVEGESLILYEKGKIYEKNLFKSKFDVDEFLTQCRSNGYFDLSQIHTAILETNGKVSFLPKSFQRPATPQDLNLFPEEEAPVANIVLDGKIMDKNLKYTGNNKAWLEKQLHAQGVKNIEDVFLATCDFKNRLTIYKKTKKEMKRDIFS